jgi:hypothetical protein
VIGKFGIQTLEQFFAMFGENLIQTGTLWNVLSRNACTRATSCRDAPPWPSSPYVRAHVETPEDPSVWGRAPWAVCVKGRWRAPDP